MSPIELASHTASAVAQLRRALIVDRSFRSVIYVATLVWSVLVLLLDVRGIGGLQSARTILDVLGVHEDAVGSALLAVSVVQLWRIWTGRPTRWFSWVMHCVVLALWISSVIVLAWIHGGYPAGGLSAMIAVIGCGLATRVVGRVEKT